MDQITQYTLLIFYNPEEAVIPTLITKYGQINIENAFDCNLLARYLLYMMVKI